VLFYKNQLIPLKIEMAWLIYYFFVLAAFISYIFNTFVSDEPSLFYVLRYLEYFVFFIAGSFLTRTSVLLKFLVIYCVIQLFTLIPQSFDLLPAFSSTAGVSFGILAGTTGGPWEVTVTLSLSIVVLLDYLLVNKKSNQALALFLFTNLIFLFIGQRSPIVAIILVFSLMIYRRIGLYLFFKSTYKFLIFLIFPIGFYLFSKFQTDGYLFSIFAAPSRFISIFNSKGSYLFFLDYYKFIDIEMPRYTQAIGQWKDISHLDLSWVQRIEKWSYIIKKFVAMMPQSLFLGIGPGSSGPSLDSGILRLFLENGLIGITLFLAFLRQIYISNKNSIAIILILFLNMTFIDVNIAYKVMSLFLFISGTFFRNKDFLNS
ncbi:oligosaccharide repeat unit polymerase, partial [Candidatus Thioglobus sp.]|nr:oligosaccharide repeat unit polymerase [Candidatus Thioglobus sp.]